MRATLADHKDVGVRQAVAAFKPGLHAHYKGGKYTALFLVEAREGLVEGGTHVLNAGHHEGVATFSVYVIEGRLVMSLVPGADCDPWVIYVSLTHGSVKARPLFSEKEDAWTDFVDWPVVGKLVAPRFTRVP